MRIRVSLATGLAAFGVGLLASYAFAQDAPVSVDGTVGPKIASAPVPMPRRPATYGTSNVSYYVIDASEIAPVAVPGVNYSAVNNYQLRYRTDSGGIGFLAPLHLPGGALVTYLEIDYYDNSNTGEVQASFGVCDFAGQSCAFQPGSPGCGDAPVTICSGNTAAPGFASTATDLSGDGIVIDNFYNRYTVAVGNTTTDGLTAISQIIVGYVLQVSPDPAYATFTDVPVGHPQHQFVEALVAAGITAGCGGGNYCPNATLTRGQMAVFLSKALGLQWH